MEIFGTELVLVRFGVFLHLLFRTLLKKTYIWQQIVISNIPVGNNPLASSFGVSIPMAILLIKPVYYLSVHC